MSVSYKDFLNSAEVLLTNPDSTEMDFRNLISRSYYAAFHLSREISADLPMPDGKLGSHEQVIRKFEQHTDKRFSKLAILIRQRKSMRATADYDLHLAIKRTEAAEHFLAVKHLLAKLELLAPQEVKQSP